MQYNVVSSNPYQVYSIQHYVIKFVSDFQQVGDFLCVLWVSSTNKIDRHDTTEIVESGAKHHISKPTLLYYEQININRKSSIFEVKQYVPKLKYNIVDFKHWEIIMSASVGK